MNNGNLLGVMQNGNEPLIYNAVSVGNTEYLDRLRLVFTSRNLIFGNSNIILHEFNRQCIEMHLQRKCQLFHLDFD